MKLSILIPTIERDKNLLEDLMIELIQQCENNIDGDKVQILIDNEEKDTIGKKRNRLLERASGEYVAFIDSDDSISENYIEWLLLAAASGDDCASLKGIITTNGGDPRIFEHSLKYKEWKTNSDSAEVKYERYPNHLSPMKASIAKQFKFPEINHGEDHLWSKAIHESGLLKTEYNIPEIIYYYKYISNK